ncbi:MAG: hypothetical protein CMJ25_01480 [Phycisphaerae bacterium]|nr:hypothetical protein [Phycisphaerae bacterium]|tara:strand:- start:214 stop:939 length:726 start_codon:yes stop_codon:yes gene_type:complete
MARIATYPNDVNIVAADKWIGSDSQNNFQTKNFTAGDVANFINIKASQSQLLRYTYQTEGTLKPASISFDPYGADVVQFSTINAFVLSKFDAYSNEATPPIDVSGLYNAPFKTSNILMTQCNDMSQWAIFQWDNEAKDPSNNNFYDITLTFKSGNGSLKKNEDYFISLLTYNATAASDKNFVFTQTTAASTWVVTHNLNKYPSVSVVDSANTTVYGEVAYNSLNQVTITFKSAFTGKAFFN